MKQPYAVLAKGSGTCTTLKIGARSAKVSVLPRSERFWRSTFPEAQSKVYCARYLIFWLINGREGDKIVLEGEADQVPDQQPGDIVFGLAQTEHETFRRQGVDLLAEIEISLVESLCGFSRVVIKHLDGRGIQIQHPQAPGQVLEPGQVIKVGGEGMPHKKSDLKGDLFLLVKIKFPDHAWLVENQAIERLRDLLPKPEKAIQADEIDEVDYDGTASIEDFGQGEGGEAWVDEDEEDGQPQCAQQ